MSEVSAPLTQDTDPLAGMSTADLAGAFASAKPVDLTAPPVAPVEPVAPAAPAAPASENAAPPVAPDAPAAPVEPVAPAAPDYAAYLRDTFGVEQPDAIKTALEAAKEVEALRTNQRTPEDIALQALIADPSKGAAYLKLQTTDYKTLPTRDLLAAAYAHDHPELPAELAEIEAELEYNAKFAAAEFEDETDPTVKAAKLRLNYATQTALAKMEGAKEAARTAVVRQAAPVEAEGPSEESQAQSAAWVAGVDAITAAAATEIVYNVDGSDIKLAFDNKNPAFREAALDPVAWLTKQLRPTGKYQETNYDRLAEIVALLTQPDVLAKNAYAAGKASLGAVVPLSQAVNPVPNAPQAPATEQSVVEAFRASAQSRRNASSAQYLP